MTERDQMKVLKNWYNFNITSFRLDFMIENNVKSEDPRQVKRLSNEQLIMIFTLSDLKDQLTLECREKGALVEKLLALFFDIFKCYDLSFDKIIEQELAKFKEQIKQQSALKDQQMRQKEKELDKALQRAQEIEYVLADNNNHIKALLAQRKA